MSRYRSPFNGGETAGHTFGYYDTRHDLYRRRGKAEPQDEDLGLKAAEEMAPKSGESPSPSRSA